MPERFMLDEMEEQPALAERLLREQPDAIDRLLAGRPRPRRVWFTGCGDMRFAGRLAAAWARASLGLEVRSPPAMDLRWQRAELGADDLVVVASISGRTPRAIEAARAARKAGALVLAITDDPSSSLAQETRAVLELGTSLPADLSRAAYAGYARPVPQTKTFLAALITEMLVAAHAAERTVPSELLALPSVLRELLERSARQLPALVAEQLPAARTFVVLGSGPFAGLASYGAAKLLEYALPAHAQCLEEFQHLELFVTGAETGLIVLAPDPSSSNRAREIASAYDELGCRALVIGAADWQARSTRHFAWTPANLAEAIVGLAIPLQRIAYETALRHGRDVNAWVGGVRGDLILRLSQKVVRSSEVRD